MQLTSFTIENDSNSDYMSYLLVKEIPQQTYKLKLVVVDFITWMLAYVAHRFCSMFSFRCIPYSIYLLTTKLLLVKSIVLWAIT